MRQLSIALLAAAVCMPLAGCGQSKEAASIYDDSEMAKYRSTPEQIAAGMQGAGTTKKPSAAELKAIEAQAKASAEAAKNSN